ncbi:universal stress protein [Sulfurospirillum diekertiae]|uniref:Universal stress protein n=1 Tax=Sulfurospirillum diekertiae TaxID=1854492 RepID=A0A290HVQ9_9BACT|nr:universal stress protein [Sulfurospirillum diekertiae]ATB69926.1 universal stress protein [Sulfurospirillum diekertiae]
MYQKILVPIDGSELSKKAVKQAVAFAKESSAELVFFHAKDIKHFLYDGMEAIFDPNAQTIYEENITTICQAFLDEALSIAQANKVVSQQILVENSTPYQAIIDYAHSHTCDLILMASHGFGALEGIFLGSQTNKVIVLSKIPVLIIK